MGTFSDNNLKFLYSADNLQRAKNMFRVLLQANGAVTLNGADSSALDGKSVTFGGAAADYLKLLDPTGNLASSDFYLYARFSIYGNSSNLQAVFGRAPGSGNQSYYLFVTGDRTQVYVWSSTDGTASAPMNIGGAANFTDGLPHTVEVSRQAGTVRVFFDGVQIASASRPSFYSNPTAQCLIGRIGVTGYEYPSKLILDEIALVIGEAVETADHAVRTTPFPEPSFTCKSLPPTAVIKGASRGLVTVRPQSPVGSIDMEDGGLYRIVSTVEVKGTPNVPVHRRVVLINERSRRVVRETWSDPVTGEYRFEGIRGDVTYTTMAYDYTNNKRAAVADNLTAERMP